MKFHIFTLFFAGQLSLLSIIGAVAMAAETVESAQPGVHPSFSAHYRFQHQPSTTVLDEARVLFSKEGTRVEQMMHGAANIFIANYVDQKFWFVDRQRQLVHAIPLVAAQHDSQASGGSMVHARAGFIQLSPCSGLTAQAGETQLWQGRTVQHWNCLRRGELVEEQWYAPDPGVVVRSLTSDGYLSELTDLSARETSSQSFQPPSHYRQVSIEELMNPAVPIGAYIEQTEPISP